MAAEAAEKQRQFERKQQAHADEQAKAANRRAEAPANREAHERKLEKAQKHRAERERRNAENTKPRSAPLPTPP
jgi:colicin import membrane protein